MRASAMSTLMEGHLAATFRAIKCQRQNLYIRLEPGVAIDLGAKLQWFARGVRTHWAAYAAQARNSTGGLRPRD
jgi:hypothetical protein